MNQTVQAQLNQFPQIYYNGQGTGGFSLLVRPTPSLISTPLTSLTWSSKIGAESFTTSVESNGIATWAKVCLPSTNGIIKYGYMLYGQFNIRINEINNYATVTASPYLFIRPCAGCTSTNVTLNGQNASYGQNSIVALTGATENINGINWYQVYLTTDCNSPTGWLSSGTNSSFLSINSVTNNYYNVAGTVENDNQVVIWGANINIGSWSTNSTEGFYQYKVPQNWAGLINCSHQDYTTSSPINYNYIANGHNYTRNFVLSNGCSFSISPSSVSPSSSAGSNSVSVTATPGCNWTAVSNNTSWLTVTSGSSGNGNGIVNYSYTSNPNPTSRTGTITIAGHTFTVTQAGSGCSYSITPTLVSPASSSGNGSVSVTATPGCSWTAISNNTSWLTVTSGSSGTGNGSIGYSYTTNPNSSLRVGTITIAGYTFTVTQAGVGCSYSITPTSVTPTSSSGSGSVSVTATPGCSWTAISNNTSWLTVTSGSSGTGNGSVGYSFTSNPNSTLRVGTITIAGIIFTVTQAGTVPPSTISITSSVIPPWQREGDLLKGSITVDLSNAGPNAIWYLQADYFDENNDYIDHIRYPNLQSNETTQNFSTETDPELFAQVKQGRSFTWNAKLVSNGTFATASQQTKIIEKQWYKENVVYFNAASEQIKIPLKNIPGTTSINYSFSRVNGLSSAIDKIFNGTGTLSGNNNPYISLNHTNSNLKNVSPGVFNYQIIYNGGGLSETGTLDLVKIGNVGNKNLNSVVVLVGGSVNIENAIKLLPSQHNIHSPHTWSIAKDFVNAQKNTWYIATGNLNPIQKNAYNLGIALLKIKELCIDAGASSPQISVLAHSKGGLEMRMMMDEKGAPNGNLQDFTLNPSSPFDNPSIDNTLKSVIFLGTPHNEGVESGYITSYSLTPGVSIAPADFVKNQINNKQIKDYFSITGTSVPSGIRIGNVSPYRQCNSSDGGVTIASSDDPFLRGRAVTKYYVKDIGAPELSVSSQISIEVLCNVGCIGASLYFTLTPSFDYCGTACMVSPNIVEFFKNQAWKPKFHHLYLTSSFVLNNATDNSCLLNNLQNTSTFSKILSVINNNMVANCSSPSTQSPPCAKYLGFVISSVLPNAQINRQLPGGLFKEMTKSDENGIFEIFLDESLKIGDTIQIKASGVETLLIKLDSSILINEKLIISMLKTNTNEQNILYPFFKLVNENPITHESIIQIEVSSKNTINYEFKINYDSIFRPLNLVNNRASLSLSNGLNTIAVKYNGLIDTIVLFKEVYFFHDTLLAQNTYNVSITANEQSLGTKVYVNNQFVKEIKTSADVIPVLIGRNTFKFTKFGYIDSLVNVDSATMINIALQLFPHSYTSPIDSNIFDFPLQGRLQYRMNVTMLDSARLSIISIKQMDVDFLSKALIPKSRKFEFRHLNSPTWSNIKTSIVLDQSENLCKDSIYLLKILDDAIYSKIAFDNTTIGADYDSIVQKLTYNYINFNQGTAKKEELVIMKKLAPIVHVLPEIIINKNDTLFIPLTQLFSDPDSLVNDMLYEVGTHSAQLNIQIINNSVRIITQNVLNGNPSFTIRARHDGIWRNNNVNVGEECTTPGIPKNVLASELSDSSIYFSWDSGIPNGSNPVDYYWLISTSPNTIYNYGVKQGVTNSNSVVIDGLDNNLVYYCRVFAVTRCDNSQSPYATSNPIQIFNACITPSKPENLGVSVISQTSASLSWEPGIVEGSTPVSYFWVVSTNPNVAYGNGLAQGRTNSTFDVVSGLTPGITYYARVFALTGCNGTYSSYSNWSSFTTYSPCITPGTPENIIANVTGQNSVFLTWNKGVPEGSPDLSYQWVIGLSPDVIYENALFKGITNFNAIGITSLLPGTTYYFRVFSKTNCNNTSSSYSMAKRFSTIPNCATPTSQSYSISFSFVSTQQFTVNWANGNGSRRVVKINTLNQFTPPANGTDPIANPVYSGSGQQVVYNGNGNSVTVTGLKPNTVYWVRVYEANCEGIYSLYNTSLATQNPNSQQTVLVPPHIQSFTASTVMPLPGGGTQREIFYDNTNVYGVNAPITVAADGSANTVFTLKASFITGMGFRIVNKQGKIVTNGDLAFDPVRYGRLGVKQILSHNTMEMTYTHPQLVDDAVLPLRIQLLYHDGLLGITIPLNFVAASPLPVQISSLNAYHDQKNNLNEISWTTQSERNNDHFVLLRKIENENMIPVTEIQGSGNSDLPVDYIYLDKDLHRNGIYYYQLEQVDFDGKKMYSDIVQVSVHKGSNVTTSIYPNPTNGLIYCKIDGKYDIVQIQLFDLLGNKMGESESSRFENQESNPSLSCEHLSGGVYQVVIWVDGEVFNHKVVLIK